MSKILIFDIEIAKPIEAVGGWEGAKKGLAGISSAVVWDSDTQRYHLYDANTLDELVAHLNSGDLIVGWNSRDFDIPCIEGVTGQKITAWGYDMLQEIWAAIGRFYKGYKLGDVCYRTLGLEKSGNGESAPHLAATGQWAKLFDYNLNDVHLTKSLYNHVVNEGFIIDVDGEPLHLECPLEETA